MGVPGFFAYILKNQRLKQSILTEDIDIVNPDILYLDFNGIIHTIMAKVRMSNDNWKTETEIEKKGFIEITKYVEYLIKKTNTKSVYIGIDGPCPMGKIMHQRERRYKTVIDTNYINKLKDEHSVEKSKYWPTSKISPGTEFMYKLDNFLEKYVKKSKIPITISSSIEPGEGEHKIIHHIKKHKDKKVMIYGLDADLLFLTLSLNTSVFLLREGTTFNKENANEFMLVDIDILRKEILLRMGDNENAIKDFIFICFLLGNDFLPKSFTLDIYTNGIPFLINEYKKNKSKYKYKSLISDKNNINFEFLEKIIFSLSQNEEMFLKKQYNNFKNRKIGNNRTFESEYSKQLYIYENVLNVKDTIQLTGENLKKDKQKYYKVLLKEENIERLCYEYLKTLNWCTGYYFDKCLSWTYNYNHHYSPFLSDISEFLKKYKKIKFEYELSKPLKPIEQLLIIIPPVDKKIIPTQFRTIYNLPMYKHSYKQDTNYINKRYQMKLTLNDINLHILRNEIKKRLDNIKLTKYIQYLI